MFFFLMIRRPPRSTLSSSSAASDVYKTQPLHSPSSSSSLPSARPAFSPLHRPRVPQRTGRFSSARSSVKTDPASSPTRRSVTTGKAAATSTSFGTTVAAR
eukprot:TRINITY_DN45152_c0_g1_i1.p2 TRINITY_DN45152_c0_g1~~TRINITY_DN45152_c0_g1_i1.p2  ORF type:complete len:101 (-),score=19.39 TRINITY_DN45152_c0_g1_i1:900-1202(-)